MDMRVSSRHASPWHGRCAIIADLPPQYVKEFQTHFCHRRRTDNVEWQPWQGGAALVFPPYPEVTFCLSTEQMNSIGAGNSWHVTSLPTVRGGSYGTSRCRLCTPGSQPDGALPRDRRAPGDLPFVEGVLDLLICYPWRVSARDKTTRMIASHDDDASAPLPPLPRHGYCPPWHDV